MIVTTSIAYCGTYTRKNRTYHWRIERTEEYCWELTTDDPLSGCCHTYDEVYAAKSYHDCAMHLNEVVKKLKEVA